MCSVDTIEYFKLMIEYIVSVKEKQIRWIFRTLSNISDGALLRKE